jgi:hypothetical protein
MASSKVRILKRNLIDDTKWNDTIRQSANSLPYAYTWYLDALCWRWVGVIIGDYDHVMPLPIGRKWGLLYVYQPLFCQQLGVFYRKRNDAMVELLIKTALRKFVFVNLNLNYDNGMKRQLRGLGKKKNLVLHLNRPHSEIQKDYSENTQRNIKKAVKAGLTVDMGEKKIQQAFTDFYITHTAVKDDHFKVRHEEALRKLVHQFLIHECGKLFLAKNPDGLACAGVIESGHRLIHLLPAADDFARQNGGMHYLIDTVLKHYENSGKLYDFEGSSVESIARFYESFGAVNQPFYVLSKSPFKASRLG